MFSGSVFAVRLTRLLSGTNQLMDTRNAALDCARRVKLMVFDIDGVMTDGSLFFDHEGHEYKVFHSRDGLGLRLLRESGVRIAVITGRKAPCVEWRMKNLRIDLLFQGVDNKLETLHNLLRDLNLQPEEAGFMGDDVIDLQVMAACGFSAAPADAHPLAKRYARFITEHNGGHGAARDVCELILEAQGTLDAALARFLPPGHV